MKAVIASDVTREMLDAAVYLYDNDLEAFKSKSPDVYDACMFHLENDHVCHTEKQRKIMTDFIMTACAAYKFSEAVQHAGAMEAGSSPICGSRLPSRYRPI